MKKLIRYSYIFLIFILIISGCKQVNKAGNETTAQEESMPIEIQQPESFIVMLPQINNENNYYAAHWISFSPDGNNLAVAASNGVIVYKTSTLTTEPVAEFITTEAAVKVAWSPDSEYIAYANAMGEETNNGMIITTSVKDPYPRKKFDVKRNKQAPWVSALQWLPDRDVLYFDYGWSGSSVHVMEAWDMATDEQIFIKESPLSVGEEAVKWDTGIGEFSPDGKTLAFEASRNISSDEYVSGILLVNPSDWQAKLVIETQPNEYLSHPSVTWSPDGSKLNARLQVIDVTTSKVMHPVCQGVTEGFSATWSPDGRIIALDQKDGPVLLCDANTGEILLTLQEEFESVNHLEWSPDGKLLAASTSDSDEPFFVIWQFDN